MRLMGSIFSSLLQPIDRRQFKATVPRHAGDACGNSKLPIPLRRIRIKPDGAKALQVITNDMSRSAAEIAALYKGRWQIELLCRWLKQNLKLGRFLGRNENAIRLQILAAMIAFALLRRAELAASCLFRRKPTAKIDKPPPINPSKPKSKINPNQIEFCYA
jgi:putative transposase